MSQCLITLPDMVTTYAPVYGMGQLVTLKTRNRWTDDHSPGMVTGYMVRPHGISYMVTFASGQETVHYDIELEGVDG